MSVRKFWYVAALAAVAAYFPSRLLDAQSAGVGADFERAGTLRARIAGKVYGVADSPTWIDNSRLWFRKSVKGGSEFLLVDAATGSTRPAFDHAKIAEGLSFASGTAYSATTLPFESFTFVTTGIEAIEFAIGPAGPARGGGRGGAGQTGPRWRCTIAVSRCEHLAASGPGPAAQGGRGARGGGGGNAGAAQPNAANETRPSPDGKVEALIQNYNVFVRPANGRAADLKPLSFDGSEGNAYTLQSIVWAPDSSRLVAYRRIPGYQRIVTYVQSSPPDQLQPKTMTRVYRKPGDEVDRNQPVVFEIASGRQIEVDRTLFPNPYDISRPAWRSDSRTFTFEYNQRGHQVYRVLEADAATGRTRAIIDETSQAFIDYRPASPGLTGSGRRYRYDVGDGKEIIWMSERDGWSHLYLYDAATGRVKNQITRGAWAVHNVDRVDEANRQIWFTANGMNPKQDPYFFHIYRINFDGTGLTAFTSADGTHTLTWSPDRQFYVDTYSRVDMPQIAELRRASDQSLIATLSHGDMTDLLATGWRPPEVFTAKGRDGATDIWGIIVRPTNFDPNRRYPVIEAIYAGPHGSFVPKTFNAEAGASWLIGAIDMQTLAELGFIVVQIDGMGTANRSKAFHDVAWKNLADGGFPDRILWHKAVAAKYPYYDITRVGIYGTSAGGQNALAAMLFHPEFYKAAAASAGCHDNRMDKIWWNEQWMGWPIGPQYAASSNTEHAKNLQGKLLLLLPELDTNVDPASTMQVVNQLVLANKDFDFVMLPNQDHSNGGAYGDRKRFDFFVRSLQGREPPAWNQIRPANGAADADSVLDARARAWIAAEDWEPR
jgi:dipeptidyl aminopeptidase/acylaminoacyl peptidase